MSKKMSPGQITGFYKLKDTSRQCIDCIDGWCQMNCGPVCGEPPASKRGPLSTIELSEYGEDQTND
ncbi:MAG: hypothetical protein GOVbin52_8 [Prokaryotic dsDNA virus sp.]|nr:MAG: hypothetical protein GOVbin52_8 [Prokaryotic dsDNA virus sp.]